MSTLQKPISQPNRPAPVIGPDNRTFSSYWYQWLLELVSKLNAVFVGSAGNVTLVAGVASVPLIGLSPNSIAFISLNAAAGTLGIQYRGVCTADTLTITALNADLSTATLDVSTVNYVIYNTSV